MKFLALLLGLALLAVALFCVVGALASLEPAPGGGIHTGWLLVYGVVGAASLLGSVLAFLSLRGTKD